MRRSLLVLTMAFALGGAPAQPRHPAPRILGFTLQEREGALTKQLGPAEHTSVGTVYRTLDYNFDSRSDEDFDWTFYFDRPSGNLVSVTRNFEKPVRVANLLTGQAVHRHTFINGSTTMPAVSRVLPGDRVLIAIGVEKPTDLCSQMILLRKSALARFYPWIAQDLK